VAWLVWIYATRVRRTAVALASLLVLEVAAAVLSLWSSVAIGFLVAGALAAGAAFELPAAVALSALGPALLAVLTLATGGSGWNALLGAAGALAGLFGGVARREAEDRARQQGLLTVASERAELEHARAQVLAERNRLAREVHDVLAHTLGAVAVQLEAATAVHDNGADPARLRELLHHSRQLVAEGLTETSRAVRALRDEPVDLDAQLAALVAGEAVELEVRGEPRPLAPDAGLALYRAAQEAITNVRKHAPGAPAHVVLDFRPDATVLTVANGAATSKPGPKTGSGLGLQGMRERLELAGGRLDAGASEAGWTVEATVPA
jgi:signal transduction histidine kinase